jgi:hypothetical protein
LVIATLLAAVGLIPKQMEKRREERKVEKRRDRIQIDRSLISAPAQLPE